MVNEADAAAFKKLRGIGEVYSNRIIKYRQLLGGFYRIDQIREVYGISDSLFRSIMFGLQLGDSVRLNTLNINQAISESLARHPYIDYSLANEIVISRTVHGPFQRPDDLLLRKVVDSATYYKVRPYLRVD
jgi:DNA uptake protein ComE-like DNA-binding protein